MAARLSVEEVNSRLGIIEASVKKLLSYRKAATEDMWEYISEAYIDVRRAAAVDSAKPIGNINKWIATVSIRAAQRLLTERRGMVQRWKGKKRSHYEKLFVTFTDAGLHINGESSND